MSEKNIKKQPSKEAAKKQLQQILPQVLQQGQNSNLLSTSKVQSGAESKGDSSAIYFDIKNKHPIKPIIYTIFKILSFACNFNYSVENAVITMMMITFLTPNIVDSLIWIIPNIIAIFLRPYLIRYVHKAHKAHRMRSQAFLINTFLIIAAVGSFLIAQSGLMNQSKKGFHALRILVCSIGWTMTGMSFELVEYFVDKLKQSLQQQCYIKNTDQQIPQSSKPKDQQFVIIDFDEQQRKTTLANNNKFLGSLCGYVVVLLLFLFPFKNIKKMASFFEQSSLAYNINGFITLLVAIAFYMMISYSGIPKQDPQTKPKPISFKLSYSPNYYLPGLSELRSMSPRGLIFLAIHFMIVFVMDVMFIYTTMWTAGSEQTANMKESQANFYGINNGVVFLIVFTFVYYGNALYPQDSKHSILFRLVLVISSLLFVVCFWFGKSGLFLPLIISLAITYKIYEDKVEVELEQIQPQIKVSKELVIRIEKIAVLNVMPFMSMILLGRDDIQDCMLWCAILLVLIGVLLKFYTPGNETSQSDQKGSQESKQKQTEKQKKQ